MLSPICINMSFQELFTQILPNVQKIDIIVIKEVGGAMLNYAMMSMKKETPLTMTAIPLLTQFSSVNPPR